MTYAQIPARQVEGFTPAVEAVVADAVAGLLRLVPWTTTTTAGPDLMWDDDDNLMMVEVS